MIQNNNKNRRLFIERIYEVDEMRHHPLYKAIIKRPMNIQKTNVITTKQLRCLYPKGKYPIYNLVRLNRNNEAANENIKINSI